MPQRAAHCAELRVKHAKRATSDTIDHTSGPLGRPREAGDTRHHRPHQRAAGATTRSGRHQTPSTTPAGRWGDHTKRATSDTIDHTSGPLGRPHEAGDIRHHRPHQRAAGATTRSGRHQTPSTTPAGRWGDHAKRATSDTIEHTTPDRRNDATPDHGNPDRGNRRDQARPWKRAAATPRIVETGEARAWPRAAKRRGVYGRRAARSGFLRNPVAAISGKLPPITEN
jgi:hypothetical protein